MNVIADFDVWHSDNLVANKSLQIPIAEEKPFEEQDFSEDSRYLIEDAETIEDDYLQYFSLPYKSYTPSKIYVSVTNNCNMYCRHCGHNSGPENNDFMSRETFKAALKWETRALLNFGGGEPTCHPLFWEFMEMAIKFRGEGRVWIATNGKRTNDALLLARMIKGGIIQGVLSQDQWHEPIEQDVVKAFLWAKEAGHKHTIRDISKSRKGNNIDPIRSGRCDWGNRWECMGSDMPFVQHDGKVRQCACIDAPIIGDVFAGYKSMFPEEWGDPWACAFGKPSPA